MGARRGGRPPRPVGGLITGIAAAPAQTSRWSRAEAEPSRWPPVPSSRRPRLAGTRRSRAASRLVSGAAAVCVLAASRPARPSRDPARVRLAEPRAPPERTALLRGSGGTDFCGGDTSCLFRYLHLLSRVYLGVSFTDAVVLLRTQPDPSERDER